MTFARQWGSGLADGQPATGAKLTQLDINVSRSLDGFAGGKVTPSAKLNISGAGLQVGDAGEDPLFAVGSSKWLAAAMDLNFGVNIALVLNDVCPIDEGRLFATASGNDKIATSTNDGYSWTDISGNIGAPQTIALKTCASNFNSGSGSAAGTLVAGGNNAKVYYSTNQGVSWSNVTLPGSPTAIDVLFYDLTNNLFVAIGKTAGAPYIATAATGTPGTWTQRTVPASITGSVNGQSVTRSYAGRLVASWTTQTKVAYSDDGITWTASATSLTSQSYSVRFGDGVFVALDVDANAIAYVSTDGNTWSSSGVTKPTASAMPAVWFTALNGVFAMIGTSGLYFSDNKGLTWRYITNGGAPSIGAISFVKALQGRIFEGFNDGTNTAVARSRKIGFHDRSSSS